MKSLLTFITVICFIVGVAVAEQHSTPDTLIGTWMVQDGSAKVKIEKTNNSFSGKIVWLKIPNDKNGKPFTDSNNPNASLRNRPQMGLNLLNSFVYEENNHWTNGTIYDPDEGKTYSCKITMTDNQTIEVRGYVGISLFGRTETWKRVPDPTITMTKTE